ncbi:MAG: DinB family protein [Coprothermobacterota bacterium]|nr:DinB family protein [Coprothermobacterota bacterium]
MKQLAALETRTDGRTMVHALTLPGCFVRGADRETALVAFPKEIEAFLGWLEQKGIHPENTAREWELVEEQQGVAPFESGDDAALFQLDLLPPEDAELESYLRVSQAARDDLLALTVPLSLEERKAPRSEIRTIEGILWHIAHAEEWYISRLGVIPELHAFDAFPGTLFEYLAAVRRLAQSRFRSLTSLERATIYRFPEYTSHPDEPWNLRKALRRMIEHEREHTANIRRILE